MTGLFLVDCLVLKNQIRDDLKISLVFGNCMCWIRRILFEGLNQIQFKCN